MTARAPRIPHPLVRALLVAGLAAGAIALSVVASVWGLSAELVGVAIAALAALRIVHAVRTEGRAERARPPQRAFVITAVVIIGFFVLLTLASTIWASH
jgi:hypothetical protein